jgi:hypothetical protein
MEAAMLQGGPILSYPMHIWILDRTSGGGYFQHTLCHSWLDAIETWMDGQEPIRIHVVSVGIFRVYRG